MIYLSDPFIRCMVGPQLKLTERRRVLVYNHLRMIGHAAMLFRTEHGRAPKSLEELAKTQMRAGASSAKGCSLIPTAERIHWRPMACRAFVRSTAGLSRWPRVSNIW